MTQYFNNAEDEKYPAELDDFTYELMLAIIGEKNMIFEKQFREEKNRPKDTKPEKTSMKDRFAVAKTEADNRPSCKTQETSPNKER